MKLITGARAIHENDLIGLTLFYTAMVHSFLYVNNLFYKSGSEALLLRNLWFTPEIPFKHLGWCQAGFNTVLDLPFQNGEIDVYKIKSVLVHDDPSWYLHCCSFQQILSKQFSNAIEGSHLVHTAVLLQAKAILQKELTSQLSLEKWCEDLSLLPYSSEKTQQIFFRMLVTYKVNKFWEINFKILACILATPKIISTARKELNVQ